MKEVGQCFGRAFPVLLNKSGFPQRNEPGFHRHESIVRDGLTKFAERGRGTAARIDPLLGLHCLPGT